MPELPEVEVARRAVHEHCSGKVIVKAMIADDPKVIEGISPSELEKALVGKKIIAAHRKGKNMWLQLDTPPFPSFQFGMTGAVYIKGVSVTKYKRSAINDNDEWPSKFSKVFVELDDGMEMSFTDKRRFAKVRLLENPEVVPPISELGPDALLNPMAEDDFINALSKRGTAIKSLLLDQGFISGIGNWVADEVLYKARIHPLQVASTVSKEKCIALHKCIKEVIEKALEVGADSSQYPENWIFHSREKKPGKAFVDGKKIDFITVGSRTSAFVPDLQKIDGPVPGNQPVRKGGNRSKKKGDVVESEKFPSDQEIGDDDDEGKDKKGQGKRGRKSTKTTKAQTGSSNSTKTTKARTGSSNASGAGGKKSANKAAEDEKPKKRSGWKTLDEIESSIQGDATLKEKAESEQELEKEEIKEVKLDHITKKRGKGQESAKVGMTETAASGKMGKNKRKIAAKVEKPRKKGTTKKDNEVDMLDQTNNLDASAKTSENAS